MKLITLTELMHLPKGAMFTRADQYGNPTGGVYVWDTGYPESPNPFFGYAVHLSPNGHLVSYFADALRDVPSRFYYHTDYREAYDPEYETPDDCDLRFWLYSVNDLKYIIEAATRAMTLPCHADAGGEGVDPDAGPRFYTGTFSVEGFE